MSEFMEFKLIVAGGRDYQDYNCVSHEIPELANGYLNDYEVSIVSGLANGADSLGLRFAIENKVKYYEFPADWGNYPETAGILRNIEMSEFADGLLAFWDGLSKGTCHMIDTMAKKNKFVKVVRYTKLIGIPVESDLSEWYD